MTSRVHVANKKPAPTACAVCRPAVERACHAGLPLDRSEEGLAIWRRGLAALADCPNVVIKLSELGLPHGRWDIPSNVRVVREAAAIFGPDRILFGSNLPVSTLTTDFRGIVAVVRKADILPDNRDVMRICEKLGFRMKHSLEDEVVKAEFGL